MAGLIAEIFARTCPHCGGSGWGPEEIDCDLCGGSGKEKIVDWQGRFFGLRKCSDCDGTGKVYKKCDRCKGVGLIPIWK